jgi:hypothetical protein
MAGGSPGRLAGPALFSLLAVGASPCWALHPLITEDTGTLGRGNAQLELATSYERDRDGDQTTYLSDPTLTVTYGASDVVDLFLAVPTQHIRVETPDAVESASGISDPAVGFKWRFHEDGNWSVATKPALILPAGNHERGLGKGRAGYNIALVSTTRFGVSAFHAHGAIIGNPNLVGERSHLWHASVALEHEASARLKLVADLGVDRNANPNATDNPTFLLGGLVYTIGSVDLSFGMRAGLNAVAPDRALLFGVTLHAGK